MQLRSGNGHFAMPDALSGAVYDMKTVTAEISTV